MIMTIGSNDNWYSMSPFCDDYGIDYSTGNNLGEVAELVQHLLEIIVLFQMTMWNMATMVTPVVVQKIMQ